MGFVKSASAIRLDLIQAIDAHANELDELANNFVQMDARSATKRAEAADRHTGRLLAVVSDLLVTVTALAAISDLPELATGPGRDFPE